MKELLLSTMYAPRFAKRPSVGTWLIAAPKKSLEEHEAGFQSNYQHDRHDMTQKRFFEFRFVWIGELNHHRPFVTNSGKLRYSEFGYLKLMADQELFKKGILGRLWRCFAQVCTVYLCRNVSHCDLSLLIHTVLLSLGSDKPTFEWDCMGPHKGSVGICWRETWHLRSRHGQDMDISIHFRSFDAWFRFGMVSAKLCHVLRTLRLAVWKQIGVTSVSRFVPFQWQKCINYVAWYYCNLE